VAEHVVRVVLDLHRPQSPETVAVHLLSPVFPVGLLDSGVAGVRTLAAGLAEQPFGLARSLKIVDSTTQTNITKYTLRRNV